MKNFKFISILGVLLCLCMMFNVQSCCEDPIIVTGNIEGTVTDSETGEALQDVMIDVGVIKQGHQTGGNGTFLIKEIEAGTYKLLFSKDGYMDDSRDVTVIAGKTAQNDVALKPAKGNIEGTVTDFVTRQAISGVMVDIVSNGNTAFVKQSRQTGNDGKFSFKDIRVGDYKLSFSCSGYAENNQDVRVSANQTVSSDITLTPQGE
jgi:hypothetical protein